MWRERESGDPELAALLRPEASSLADEICAQISRSVPAYSVPDDKPFDPVMRRAAEQAIATFVDRIADPAAPSTRLNEMFRLLGQNEAYHDRDLNDLQAAFRVAIRVSWQRTAKICARRELSSETVAALAEAQLEYMDELAAISVEGYTDAMAQSDEELAGLRRRLLRLVLERPPAPRRAIAELAERADWTVPAEVTIVVTRPGARLVRTVLPDDVLVDVEAPEPRLLIPGPLTEARRSMLEAALPGDRIVVGVTVPLEEAADSLRWAVRAHGLVQDGVLPDARVIRCDDHLLTLWLMSDPLLMDELARRRLTRLSDMSPAKQKALTETLRVWLESWSTAADVGGRLHVHPQTVRYRLNQLKESLGDPFTDPEARFALELVLRAMRLREQAGRTRSAGRSSRAS